MEKLLRETGYIHRPLPIEMVVENTLESFIAKKKVYATRPLVSGKADIIHWRKTGIGEVTCEENGTVKMKCPTVMDKWPEGAPLDGDYANYGVVSATYCVGGESWEGYNRMMFTITPDCDGMRNPFMFLSFVNDGIEKLPDAYNREGVHSINLRNHTKNICYLEIDSFPRDRVMEITFYAFINGKDRTTGDTMRFEISDIQLQQTERAEISHGFIPADNEIIYATSGYRCHAIKQALSTIAAKEFFLYDEFDTLCLRGAVTQEKTSIGTFSIIDFSEFKQEGRFYIKMGKGRTALFPITHQVWLPSIWKALNFIFCERCGYPVPEKHGTCHGDIVAVHNGLTLIYNGGWHDAGDVSQQTLQTGDVMFALFEIADTYKNDLAQQMLYNRFLEEAEWGLDFILKCRFGDGYRATSAGITRWSDGLLGNMDDAKARVHNNAFENFLLSGYEAYAFIVLPDTDPMLKEKAKNAAIEDFLFAMEHYKINGYGELPIMWEHSYHTSKSQFMATVSWAAGMLYRITGEVYYANTAIDFAEYVLDCQRIEPIGDIKLSGFFYRDMEKKVIMHFNHQSRDAIYIQAIEQLIQFFPAHEKSSRWQNCVYLFGSYLKKITKLIAPYGMIPSGIYHINEAEDTDSFIRQHLFPGTYAKEDFVKQIKNGLQIDDEHYLRFFPCWFSFRGNTAIHLSTGKSAAICGRLLKDKSLLDIAEEQLRWIVGKNPFGQSLMYGEGCRYAQQYAVLPGEMIGEIPVGIQTKDNLDLPYYPQANNATYKEVWVTSAGKWLSLVAEIEKTCSCMLP